MLRSKLLDSWTFQEVIYCIQFLQFVVDSLEVTCLHVILVILLRKKVLADDVKSSGMKMIKRNNDEEK